MNNTKNKVKVAAIQFSCEDDIHANLSVAENAVREAASNGAKIILLPELFERKYFCQERRYEYYEYALETEQNAAVILMKKLAAEYDSVIIVSFYEKDGMNLYNSVAVIDADGKVMGVYRKTHIPDDHFYQEKFYFTPGDTGFKTWNTKYGCIGVGICWDQWFPETARMLTLNGADILFYPTAIGSEPILECDSMEHWRRCMQGHAAANIIPVVAANRYGTEKVTPCEENANQSSELCFYGSSFITDEKGAVIAQAQRAGNSTIYGEFDFENIRRERFEWGVFRDRRPECYCLQREQHQV